jgi:hypothetical protein
METLNHVQSVVVIVAVRSVLGKAYKLKVQTSIRVWKMIIDKMIKMEKNQFTNGMLLLC